jgi:ABC-2 type transport system permease protein
MWLSAAGRFRGRVLGAAVLLLLVQYLLNVLGQMIEGFRWLRPLTIFFYYQPQQIILHANWRVDLGFGWVYPVAVLLSVGAVGYLMAFRTFSRRDLPAPL